MWAGFSVETTDQHNGDDAVNILLSEGFAWCQEDCASEYEPATHDRNRRMRAEASPQNKSFGLSLTQAAEDLPTTQAIKAELPLSRAAINP